MSEAHTWRPIDLVAAAANPPEPPTIGGLLYPAKRTLLSGERDSLKTWLALILAKAEMDAGYAVGWADIDAMGAGDIVDRLRLLGVRDELISQLFLYYAPAERLAGDRLLDVAAELGERGARLFIGDAFNPFLSLHGLDPEKTKDVETFWREVADPISRAGAAPVMLDHVVKNERNRGKYAIGSERKASGAIVHLGTRIVTPFGRGRVGSSALDCHRDRQGYLPRPKVGLLEISAVGTAVTYTLRADQAGGTFRPTHLMEKISRYLEAQDKPVPRSNVEQNVTGADRGKRKAIDTLVEEGFAAASNGPRNARLIEHVRPYREAEDTEPNTDDLGDDLGATSAKPMVWVPDLTTSARRTPWYAEAEVVSDLGAIGTPTSANGKHPSEPPQLDGDQADAIAATLNANPDDDGDLAAMLIDEAAA